MKIQITAVILLSYCSHISRSCSRISCNWKLVCIQTLGYQENLRIFRVEGLPAWKANAKLQRPSLLPQVGKPWEFFHWMFGLTKFGFCADVLKSGKLIPSMNPLKTSIFALLGYELACEKLKGLERIALLQADLGNNCLTRGRSQIFIILHLDSAQFLSGIVRSWSQLRESIWRSCKISKSFIVSAGAASEAAMRCMMHTATAMAVATVLS